LAVEIMIRRLGDGSEGSIIKIVSQPFLVVGTKKDGGYKKG